ncbi:MAG: hypothetical protein QOK37_1639 [Thermoanaerobaculia bacterium]|jgi:hypothetical protein|nr:hypothetical protein [Thermoanaerobaculia bacterium]
MRIARATLLLVICVSCILFGGVATLEAAGPSVLSVKNYGAKGDGVADDYPAMKAAAAALCASPSGSRLVYPPGTYRINQYRIIDGPEANGVADVTYQNCKGVTISGYGATISVKGDFFQSADYTLDDIPFSWRKPVTPFFMLDSSDFTIEGFELYGGTDRMSKDPTIRDDASAGIATRRCSRYLLHDLDIHHFTLDAILLGWIDYDGLAADRDARLENIYAHNNARQGMSIIQVRGAWIVNCTFSDTGLTGGNYGSFNPEGGVDVEPDFTLADGMDVETGEIYFINSTFSGTNGPEFISAIPENVDSVAVFGSTIVSAPNPNAAYAFVVAPKTAFIENSSFTLRDGKAVLFGTWDNGALSSISSVVYANNIFTLDRNRQLVSEGVVPFELTNNDIHVNAGAADASFMDLRGLTKVAGNRFFIDASGNDSPFGQTAILTNGTQMVTSNEYRTNLNIGGRSFATQYGSNSAVTGEMFPNAPYFTPAGVNWSATAPYPVPAPAPTVTAPPVISNLAAVQFSTSTLISWMTDQPADAIVEYGPTISYGNVERLTANTRYHPVFLSNLQLGTTYHYRVTSTNSSAKSTASSDATFSIPSVRPPVVSTAAATGVGQLSATLRGTVNPNGASTTTSFEFGTDPSYGSSVAAQTRTGTTTQSISASPSLTCGTLYHFRAKATNSAGTRYGSDQTLTTSACPCTAFSISPSASNSSPASGSQLVVVTGSSSGCAGGSWSASGNGSWLTVSSASGSGSGSTTVSWTQNTSTSARSGLATIAGQSFTANQAGAPLCAYALSPQSATGAGTGGSGNIQVSGGPSSCVGSWNSSATSFLTLTGLTSGSGAGTWQVPYSYAANPSSNAARQATVTFTGSFPSGGTFTLTQAPLPSPSATKAPADFNADHKSDILWHHATTGENYLWTMDGYTVLSAGSINVVSDANWKVAGVADFDGDGKADVLWRHAVSGANYMYLMNGAAIIGAGAVGQPSSVSWKIAGTGDYNGDGKADILWRNASTGDDYLYLMNGISVLAAGPLNAVADTNWKVVASGDLDGDGKCDIIWRHSTTGEIYAWLMNGFTVAGAGVIETIPDQNWTIAGVGDFDGDGKADLFWRDVATGENYLYRMNGIAILERGPINDVDDLNWKVAATGDYDGDGKTDILWRHAITGDTYLYLMNGFTVVSGSELPPVPDLGWTIVR